MEWLKPEEVENPIVDLVRTDKASPTAETNAFSSAFYLSVQLDKNGAYKTGLTKEESKMMEDYLGLEPGEISPYPKKGKDGFYFLADLCKPMNGAKGVLNLTDPREFILYRAALVSTRVCNHEGERDKWPSAVFTIINEEAAAKGKFEKVNYKFEAYDKLKKLTPEEMRGVAKIFEIPITKNSSENVIKTKLLELIERDAKEFLSVVDSPILKTRILVKDAISFGKIVRAGNVYKYGDEPLGFTPDEVIAYLDNIKNSTLKGAIIAAIKKAEKSVKTE